MRILKTYSFLADALLDKSRLADAEIEAFVAGEHTGTIGYGGIFNEVRIEVFSDDFDAATGVLASLPDPIPQDAILESSESAQTFVDKGGERPSTLTFFLWGGMALVFLFCLLAVISVAFGGAASADFGGIFSLFIAGGLLGLGARVFYMRGLRDSKGAIKLSSATTPPRSG